MEKVIRDGKVAVLVSPGVGAGWYSWNKGFPQCLFDPEIVALVESKQHDKIFKLVEKKYGDGFYAGGQVRRLEVVWLPEGTVFRIDEYDGAESIVEVMKETTFTA